VPKILITTFTYPPNKDGVAEASRFMAEGLAKNGWNVFVATQFPDNFKENTSNKFITLNGVTVIRFSIKKAKNLDLNQSSEIRRYLTFITESHFDLIVNQCWEAWPTILMQGIFNQIKCPKVMVSHGYSLHIYHPARRWTLGLGVLLKGIKWTIFNLPLMISRYDQIIFLSKMRGVGRFFDHTAATLLLHRRMEVVPNSVHLGLVLNAKRGFRSKYGIPHGPLALCIANYCDRKNQKLTLSVFRKANVPGSILVFIGSELGSYGAELKAENEKLQHHYSCSKVFFFESLPREEVFSALIESDLLILTAKHETQPIVLIEAMAAGIPWISTNRGCIREMEGGIVCRCTKSLVSSLKRLLVDSTLRRELGCKGLKASQTKYSASACEMKYHRLFKELVDS